MPAHAPLPTRPFSGSKLFRFAGAVLWLYCAALLISAPGSVWAVPPKNFVLERVQSVVEGDALSLNVSLSVDNEEGLRNILKDGAILELTISVTVERKRSLWANAEVAALEFVSFIRHDPLSRDFLVTCPGRDGDKELRDRNLTRLLHASWRKLRLPLVPLELLRAEDPEGDYQIAVSITLEHAEAPPWLGKDSVFWSSSIVPGEKRLLPFRLPEAKAP